MADMRGVNKYWRQLTDAELEEGVHRGMVGGMWDEIGLLQYGYLKEQGLRPSQVLFDIGCGSMRGGLHFIRYLEPGNYVGLDINESLLKAGEQEIAAAGLADRRPTLIQDADFDFDKIGRKADVALAISLFTHLHVNFIIRCLSSLRPHLSKGGALHATFFECPEGRELEGIEQFPGKLTHIDSDPFHYPPSMIRWMAEHCGYKLEHLGDWGHPRNQKMAVFRPA